MPPRDDPGLVDTTPGASASGATHDPGEATPPSLADTRRSDVFGGPPPALEVRHEPRIGRFKIVGELGRGAMGVVLVAYDELLDRRVALKLLHVQSDRRPDEARHMLLREAQALARLSHPNVVAVHECGTHGGEVFVAMEYVHGRDLKVWLSERRRSWQEVVGVFAQAGAGLLAAHRRGLIHRDFKPSNVLVGDDGRVRVADFGLVAARAATSETPDLSPASSALDRTIGGFNSLVGTPAYLAPELFRHLPATPRSDQFAFCIALWEALYDARPFGGKTIDTLAFAIERTTLPTAPPRPEVPGWLHALVLRGLQRDPAARFPSMAELLVALEPRPPSWRPRALAAALVAGAAMAALPFMAQSPCPNGQALTDRVWTDAHAAAVADAFGRVGAPQLGAQVVGRLAEHAAAWAGASVEACEARAGDLDPRLLDARHQCLERARARFVALRDGLERGGPAATRNAQSAIDALPAPASCGAVALADLQCHAEPIDPLAREASARAAAELDEAARLELVGDYSGAVLRARAALEPWIDRPDAGVGARIRARLHLGRLLQQSDDPLAALPVLLAARDEAERVHCDDALIDLYERLLGLAAYHPSIDLGEAHAWQDLLALRVAAVGGPDDADLVPHVRGLLALHREHDLDAAARELHAALRIQQARGATATQRHADTLRLLGLVALGRDELVAAADHFTRGRDVWAAATGPDDPLLWKFEYNLGLVAKTHGDRPTARAHFERARAVAEAGLGRRSLPVAKCLVTLGILAEHEHDLDAALRLAGEALDIVDEKLPPADLRRVEYLEAFATFLTTAGREREAIPKLEQVLALLADAPDDERAWTHLAIARAYNGVDEHRAALPHATLAAEHAEHDEVPGRADLRAPTEFELGAALLGLGRAAEAAPHLEIAAQRWAQTPETAENLATARFALARALCLLGDAGGRARGLARAAREGLEADCDGPLRDTCAEIDLWLAGRCTINVPEDKHP